MTFTDLLQHFEEIIKLSMDVADYCLRGVNFDEVGLLNEYGNDCISQCIDLLFGE